MHLVVKSQQDDSIKSGIVIRNLYCELLVYVFSGPNKSLKHKSSFSLKRSTEGASLEAPGGGGVWGGGDPSPLGVKSGKGLGKGLCPLPKIFFNFLS